MQTSSVIILAIIASACHLVLVQATTKEAKDVEWQRMMNDLSRRDKCRAIYLPKRHGYDVSEHTIVTQDGYKLTLHRIIHPTDRKRGAPKKGAKKPYLLIHGLVGSSASFMRNVEDDYQAPDMWFDAKAMARDMLNQKAGKHESLWQSMADHFGASDETDKSRAYQSQRTIDLVLKQEKPDYARLNEIDYDGDQTIFGREFKEAYKKVQLPNYSKKYLSSSLALTLSNFGYDVWMINLRGNSYSRGFEGPDNGRYWKFNLESSALEDIPAGIKLIRQVSKWDDAIGVVSYSYTCLQVLQLLTNLPVYQKSLQPVVMLAPTTLTSTGHEKSKFVFKFATKAFISHNGPFPALARAGRDKIMRFVCELPVATKLCRMFEMLMYGEVKGSVTGLLREDRKFKILKADMDCGQTSTATLRQIIDNLSEPRIHSKYKVSEARARLVKPSAPVDPELRRSVILIHSDSDDIANDKGVARLKESALKENTLLDYSIQGPIRFEHSDFLFSRRSQFLVNAELVRMVTVFDLLHREPAVNRPMEREPIYYEARQSR